MASSLSQAPTLAPEDSASQVQPNQTTAPARSKAGGKRSSKNTMSKDTPPGAVKVPPGGSNKTGKTSPTTNTTIPLTGWADMDLVGSRVETIPTFTVDANPYIDLVDAEFDRIAARCPSSGKFIPYAMFRYYCMLMWWYRVLFLQKSNGQILSTEEKNFLNAFNGGDPFLVPTHIAQYLANMGNFIQGGETYFFRKLNFEFTGIMLDETVEKGWLDCHQHSTTILNGPQFWAYAQLPVPAVFATAICNEIATNDPSNPNLSTLDHVTPAVEDDDHTWLPTHNICGWMNVYRLYNHSSHRTTYNNLGWTRNTIPTDLQTCFLFSPSTMRWMSDKIAMIKEMKTHPSSQLCLSVQGAPFQAYWLESPPLYYSRDHPDYRFTDNQVKATLFTELALESRFGMDVKATTQAYSFGYRLARDKVISGFEDRNPRFEERSNFQPWIYVIDNGDDPATIVSPPNQYMVGFNATWTYGSSANLNLRRFETIANKREVTLPRSLILAD